MKIAALACALAAALSTAARAEDLRLEGSPLFDSTAQGTGDEGRDRVVLEALAGSAGAAGLGLVGFAVGAGGGNATGAALGLLGGAAVGAWLGTSITGSALGGYGNWGISALGATAGVASFFVLYLPLANSLGPFNPLFAVLVVVLPAGGATIGYELSHAAFFGPGLLGKISPSLSLSKDGRTPLAGISGTF